MANKYILKCPISLITREMQSKTTMRYHFTPTRMIVMGRYLSKRQKLSVGENVEKKNSYMFFLGGNVNY
jgi:hypothetical protein